MLCKPDSQSSSVSILVINSLLSSFCIQACILVTDKEFKVNLVLQKNNSFANCWHIIMFLMQATFTFTAFFTVSFYCQIRFYDQIDAIISQIWLCHPFNYSMHLSAV